VRELRNAMERATILGAGGEIGPECLPERTAGRHSDGVYLGGEFTLEAIEREHIRRVIEGKPTMEAAAATLGIDASTLWRKRKRFE
jgi:NtrC-family two-component system response regulator AlgB